MHDCFWAIEKARKHTSGCTKLTFQKIGWKEGGVLLRFEFLQKRIVANTLGVATALKKREAKFKGTRPARNELLCIWCDRREV